MNLFKKQSLFALSVNYKIVYWNQKIIHQPDCQNVKFISKFVKELLNLKNWKIKRNLFDGMVHFPCILGIRQMFSLTERCSLLINHPHLRPGELWNVFGLFIFFFFFNQNCFTWRFLRYFAKTKQKEKFTFFIYDYNTSPYIVW